ncbi:MAG: MFS transporter [Clostridiales bacterium]|nr:MFS transporter [Clostridiales bacterium]MCF8022148.1 MFS transporter [Clostridiales bacterium]
MNKNANSFDTNLLIIFGITLMAVLGVSSITPAFPKIMSELNLSETQVGLLITFFTLPGVFLTPFYGITADRIGRKRILLPSLLLFGTAGGLCGFTSDFNTLLVLRTLQGIGGAPLGSLNITIIGDLYQGTQRARAMGLNASILSIGTAFYPIIGGILATFAWYYPFLLPWLSLPLVLVIWKYLKNPEPESEQKLKHYLKGAWKDIKNKKVIGIFTIGILIFIILYGSYLTYFSILLGQVFNASSFTIGLLLFAGSISTALVSAQLGKINKRFNKQSIIITGFSGYTISLIIIPFVNNLWLFLLPVILFGASQALTVPVLQTYLSELVSLEYRGVLMSLNGTMLRLGQTLGPVVIGIIFTYTGYNGPFWAGAALSLFGIVIIATILKTPSSHKDTAR